MVSDVRYAKYGLTLLGGHYSGWLVYGYGKQDLELWAALGVRAGVSEVRGLELSHGYMLASIARAIVEWLPGQELVIYDNLWLANICAGLIGKSVKSLAKTDKLFISSGSLEVSDHSYIHRVIRCPAEDLWPQECRFVSF